MGLGDFISGIGEGVSHIGKDIGGAVTNVAKGTEWVANPHHWDDIGRGVAKGAEFVGHHVEDVGKAGGFLVTHPQYWGTVAKKMVVDQFTNPVNIISNVAMIGLAVATGGIGGAGLLAEGAAAAEGAATAAKVGEGAAEVANAAKTVENVGKGVQVAEEAANAGKGAAETANAVQQGGRFQRGTQAALSKFDELQQMPTKLHQGLRESVGLKPLTTVQRVRQGIAESFLERTGGIAVRETEGIGSSLVEKGRQAVGMALANAPGAPSYVGGGEVSTFAKTTYRAKGLAADINNVKNFGSNLQTTARNVGFVADPEKAAISYAKAHKGQALDYAQGHADQVSTVKNKLFGNRNQQPSAQVQSTPSTPGVPDWQRSNPGMGMQRPSSSFDASAGGAVTTTSSTMPDQVGPSSWYGQSGYNAGRGFQSQSSQQQWGTAPWSQDPAYT